MPGLDFSWLDGEGNAVTGDALRSVAGTALGIAILVCAIAFILGVADWVASRASGSSLGGKNATFFAGGAGAALLRTVLLGSLAGATGWAAGAVGDWVTTFVPVAGSEPSGSDAGGPATLGLRPAKGTPWRFRHLSASRRC